MYYILNVHLSNTFGKLSKYVPGSVFRQLIDSQIFKVTQKIAALLKFGHYECLTLLLKLFEQFNHTLASMTALEGFTFRDVVFDGVLLVLLFVYGFYGNCLTGSFMLGFPDRVA